MSNWPAAEVSFGQIGGVAVDYYDNLVVFHRGSRVWDAT